MGSHLCERLLADGHDVLCVDNFFTGRRDTIAALIGNTRFELLAGLIHPAWKTDKTAP